MEYQPFDRIFTDWKKWFAWYPVKLIDNKWVWFTTVYQRTSYLWGVPRSIQQNEYGTIFDVLENTRGAIGERPVPPPSRIMRF